MQFFVLFMKFSDSDGTPKMIQYWSKESKTFRLRYKYQKKTAEFRTSIMARIVQEADKPAPEIAADNRVSNPNWTHSKYAFCIS